MKQDMALGVVTEFVAKEKLRLLQEKVRLLDEESSRRSCPRRHDPLICARTVVTCQHAQQSESSQAQRPHGTPTKQASGWD